MMLKLLYPLIGGLAILLIPYFEQGIRVKNYKAGIKLAITMSIVHFVLMILFWWILIPFRFLTLGLGTIIVNAIVLDISSDIISEVEIDSFKSAIKGSLIYSILMVIFQKILLS